MKKFIKVVWILSAFVILLVNICFEGYRMFDLATKNYDIAIMEVSNVSFYSTARGSVMSVIGYIGKQKVNFAKFDKEIDDFFSFYPHIYSYEKGESVTIEVMRFTHSNRVTPTYNNGFHKWKLYIYTSSLYSILSITLLILIKKLKK